MSSVQEMFSEKRQQGLETCKCLSQAYSLLVDTGLELKCYYLTITCSPLVKLCLFSAQKTDALIGRQREIINYCTLKMLDMILKLCFGTEEKNPFLIGYFSKSRAQAWSLLVLTQIFKHSAAVESFIQFQRYLSSRAWVIPIAFPGPGFF